MGLLIRPRSAGRANLIREDNADYIPSASSAQSAPEAHRRNIDRADRTEETDVTVGPANLLYSYPSRKKKIRMGKRKAIKIWLHYNNRYKEYGKRT